DQGLQRMALQRSLDAEHVRQRRGVPGRAQRNLAGGDIATRGLHPGDAIAVRGETGDLTDSGAVYIFVKSGTDWVRHSRLKASNAQAGDLFGGSVAIDGDTVVIGATGQDTGAQDSGAVYVFTWNGTAWTEQSLMKASNPDERDGFGNAVAISGDTIAVGARSEDSSSNGVNGDQSGNAGEDSGAVYLFKRISTNWNQTAYLKASIPGFRNQFGCSVGVSGSTVIVGALGEGSSSTGVNGYQNNHAQQWYGAAYVFTESASGWSQQAYLKASNSGMDDKFGHSVSISGNTVLVGAPGEDSGSTGVNGDQASNDTYNSGSAYIFTRTGSTWAQQAYLKAFNTKRDARFGWSTALSG
ncbi:MAG: integrin, partial [Verrucomicrobiaceae bacterium]